MVADELASLVKAGKESQYSPGLSISPQKIPPLRYVHAVSPGVYCAQTFGATVMKITYKLKALSEQARAFHDSVLLTELEVQTWFAVTVASRLNEELLISLQ